MEVYRLATAARHYPLRSEPQPAEPVRWRGPRRHFQHLATLQQPGPVLGASDDRGVVPHGVVEREVRCHDGLPGTSHRSRWLGTTILTPRRAVRTRRTKSKKLRTYIRNSCRFEGCYWVENNLLRLYITIRLGLKWDGADYSRFRLSTFTRVATGVLRRQYSQAKAQVSLYAYAFMDNSRPADPDTAGVDGWYHFKPRTYSSS